MRRGLEILIAGKLAETPVSLGSARRICSLSHDVDNSPKYRQGPFATIEPRGEKIRCTVDAIASIPLFYAVTDELAVVSDDATEIARRIGAPISELDAKEFLETGYVTDERTLYAGINAVLPGEAIEIDFETGAVDHSRYFDLEYKGDSDYDETSLIKGFYDILYKVFESLAERLNGRAAVLPLSGGCDSRIVATMLKQVGYENIICFSYGRAANAETATSRHVADALGFKWEYVEYSKEMWDSFIGSHNYGHFLDYACKGKSIACLQPLPAMLELTNKGLLPEESVVIPGHALDYEMGSHLPYMEVDEKWPTNRFIEYVRESHYCLGLHGSEIERLIEYSLQLPKLMSRNDVLRELMAWEWRNRQSRFIANDVRAYEYAGCGFDLPFWDTRVLDYLMHIPYEGLYGRRLQYAFIRKVIDPICGISQEYPSPLKPNALKKAIKTVLPSLAKAHRDAQVRAARDQRVLADYDWMSPDELEAFEALYGPRFNMNSFVADGTLQRVRAISI